MPSSLRKRQWGDSAQMAAIKTLPKPCKTCGRKEDVKRTVGPGDCFICNSCRVSWRSAPIRDYISQVRASNQTERMGHGRPNSREPYGGERENPEPKPSPPHLYWLVPDNNVEEEENPEAEGPREQDELEKQGELQEEDELEEQDKLDEPQRKPERKREVAQKPEDSTKPGIQADVKPPATTLATHSQPFPQPRSRPVPRASGSRTGTVDACPSTCEFARWQAGWAVTMRLLPRMAAHPDLNARQELNSYLMQLWNTPRSIRCSCRAAMERPRLKLEPVLEFSTTILVLHNPIPQLTDTFVSQMVQANDMIKAAFPNLSV